MAKITSTQGKGLPLAKPSYSSKVLETLSKKPSRAFSFNIDPGMSKNAAACLTAVLCRRLASSGDEPQVKLRTTYEWASGVVNFRNAIRDPQDFWTNITLDHAAENHKTHTGRDFVYLMSAWSPGDTGIHVWAIPEPVIFDAMSRLPEEQRANKKTIKIRPDANVVQNDPHPADLSAYYRRIELIESELQRLREANEADLRMRGKRGDDANEEE